MRCHRKQTCEQDLRRGPCRSRVCAPDVEPQSRIGLGSQFPDVLQSQEPNHKCLRPQAARHGDRCGPQSTAGGNHKGRGLEEIRDQDQPSAGPNEHSKSAAVKSQGSVNINDWIKIEDDVKPPVESSRSTKRGEVPRLTW